jgi:glycosyltransferase involved in cell wall biosynthesis
MGFNFSNIWDDPRGLTGSEYAFFRVAEVFADFGHDVHIYTLALGVMPSKWHKIMCHDYDGLVGDSQNYDVIFSWNDPEIFKNIPNTVFRVTSFQNNNLDHCAAGYSQFNDLMISPSVPHLERLQQINGEHNNIRWVVIPDGCDPERYDALFESGIQKVPGRVIWASSPDRGLHWLLQEWPKIKKAVPHAHLRVFYRLKPWINHFTGTESNIYYDVEEQRHRAYYIVEALNRLQQYDVEIVDSVSKSQICEEIAKSEVMAYSCDTVMWTEGFSITLMEGCAARSCPITTAIDALPYIYGNHIPITPIPVKYNIKQFSDTVIQALLDSSFRESVNQRASELAYQHSWLIICQKIENELATHLKIKSINVQCYGHYGFVPSDKDGSGCGWIGDRCDLSGYLKNCCPICGGGYIKVLDDSLVKSI